MTEIWLGSGLIDTILALILLEGFALLAWRRLKGSGPSPVAMIATLSAGACLFLALRATVSGSSPFVIGMCLAAALIAHVSDIALRWDTSSRHPNPAFPTPVSRDEVSHG